MNQFSSGPVPVVEAWEWQLQGACRGLDASVFFHPENERGPSRRRREARAKQLCAGCPVVERCLEFALDSREPYGVWGGTSAAERDAILMQRAALSRQRATAAESLYADGQPFDGLNVSDVG